jgi:hypothetical protein
LPLRRMASTKAPYHGPHICHSFCYSYLRLHSNISFLLMWHISVSIFAKSKVYHRSTNFLSCVIPVHELLKCVKIVPKLNSDL